MPITRTIVHTRPIRDVQFVCPRCGGDRDGSLVEQRQWFAVFGVRVAPQSPLPDAVQCAECAYITDPGVLEIPTTDQLTTMLAEATVAAAVVAVRATAPAHQTAAAHRVVEAINAEGIRTDTTEFMHEVALLEHVDAVARIRRLAGELTPFGKQGFVHRLANCFADGMCTPPQRDALFEIGTSLGMSASHVNGILTSANIQVSA